MVLILATVQLGRVPAAELLVGSATTSITPQKPVGLSGQIEMRIANNVETPVTATALALETRDGGKVHDQAIMISCDLVGVPGEIVDRVRSNIRPQLPEFPAKKLLISATHTHTAPVTREGTYPIPREGVMQPSEYATFLVECLSGIAVQAWKSRQAGGVAWGLGHAVVGQNRRAVYANGKAQMYGNTTRPTFRRFEGYEDHGVEVLFFWDKKQSLQAVAVNVACPAQEVENLSVINADYWHQVRSRLRERFGASLAVLGWIGAAGDQSPHLMYRKEAEERMRKLRGLSRLDEIAKRIAAAVDEAYEGASRDIRGDVPFDHLVENLQLPVRKVTEAEFQEARRGMDRILEEQKKGKQATLYDGWYGKVIERYQQQETKPSCEMELHVIRLGDVAIATNPFELYVDYGVQMKARSKAMQTFVIQLTGGHLGDYLPTEDAVRGGGYSAQVMSNTVGPEGGQLLVDCTVKTINSLWSGDGNSDVTTPREPSRQAADAKGPERNVARQLMAAVVKNAQLIADADARSWACRRIAEIQAGMGEISEAAAAAAQITHPRHRASAYQRVAVAQAEAGDLSGARKNLEAAKTAAAQISQEHFKAWVYYEIAGAQAKAGDMAGAKATAAEISQQDERTTALSDIAEAQIKAGDQAAARQTLELAAAAAARIGDADSRAAACGKIAALLARSGDTAGAKAAAAKIEDLATKMFAYCEIAVAQETAGDMAAARQSVQEVIALCDAATDDAAGKCQMLGAMAWGLFHNEDSPKKHD